LPLTVRKQYNLVALLVLIFPSFVGYTQDVNEKAKLTFTLHQSRDIYDRSTFGEPPQFAIWLEEKNSHDVKTVFVTYKTGTGEYEGKIECPVSLPMWIGVYRQETGKNDFPRPWEPFSDGITGATPKIEDIKISVEVPKETSWFYFIEMNVAGDYTKNYPYISSKKKIDDHGNGQPSLIFKGEIVSRTGEISMPELIGRSEQYFFTTQINSELESIESAKEVFSNINVHCQ
jgi:hypothetical protein